MVRNKQEADGESRWTIPFPSSEQAIADEFAPLTAEDEEAVRLVHQRLIQDMDLSAVERMGPERGEEAVEQGVRTLVTEVAPQLYGERKEMVVRRVINDAI